MNLKKYRNILFLIFIVLIAIFLRFYQLGTVPNGLTGDEAAFGYNAYSILHTGTDEYGKFLPIVLRSFDDYKSALYSYLSIPFVWIFGLTPFSSRFASSLLSSLTVFLVYIISKKLLKNNFISLLSALIFAISPWGIIVARTTGDVTADLFFLLLLAYCLLKIDESRGKVWMLLSIVCGALAILSSQIARIYVIVIPILFISFFLFKGNKNILRSKLFYLTIIFTLFVIAYSLFASVNRLNQISIFSSPQTQLVMQEQIREDRYTPVFVTRIFHNKFVNYSRSIIENYSQYFTLDFLVLNGGYPKRERIPNTGLLFIWEIPFLLFGVYSSFKSKSKEKLFLVAWWLLFTVPAAFTFDEIPNVHRTIIVLPAISILISIGIYEFYKYLKNIKFKIVAVFILSVLILVASYEFLYFQHQYFVHQQVHEPWYHGEAYNDLIPAINKYYPFYKKIIISKTVGGPYIYILFFNRYDPKKYQQEGSKRDLDYTGFDKYYFVPLDCPLNGGIDGEDIPKGTPGYLYIDTGRCQTPKHNAKLLKTTYWQDGSPAFKILEYKTGK